MATMIQIVETGTSGPAESEGGGAKTAEPRPPASKEAATARPGTRLAAWMALIVCLEAVPWLTGTKPRALAAAVERGAAVAEARAVGEVSDDQIRKTVQKQHETLPFWTTLARIDDFLSEPLAPAVRATMVATLLGALAALVGRPVGHGPAQAACIEAQGLWVLGLATRTVLAVALGRPEIETSLALAMPPGSHPAALWMILREADAFAMLGWSVMAWGGWRRGQANLLVAATTCALLALGEATVRVWCALVFGAGIRLTLLPVS
jgi:hypothetical protein